MPLPTLFTIGYEDTSLHDFLAALHDHQVQVVVDTRERAQSRRRGYSKTALSEALKAQGVNYRHLRALGTPAPVRQAYRLDRDFAALKAAYTLHLGAQQDALSELGQLAAAGRVALLCYEKHAGECHRSLIARRLQELGLVGEVVDLSA
ncbi:DUF488 domain-containing protein [Deinococcus taeanensis]|uniref:DUF488 domain-containing protein n=1 Tax=Deinococcus taeanensis TaxID=2737050 RepID=UPI001CDD019E|nr:DUF488 domain-containing protein [Deinococcus taeanensis]UBV42261.1 DUF488 domain-containing protein [Deinococcus taeanensis]